MAIFGRLGTLVKANTNNIIDKLEDPEKMLEQGIIDMQKQLREAKQQVAVAIADEKRLRRELEKEKQLAVEWERKAMLAVKAGKDDLAKQALSRKTKHEQTALGYEKQWQGQKAATDKLKSSLNILNERIDDAKRKKNLLIARSKRAEAQQAIADTLDGLNDTSAMDVMKRMEEKIEEKEAEAEAMSELAEVADDSLDAQFRALENVNTDDALADLKAKMGLSSQKDMEPIPDPDEMKELEEIEEELKVEVEQTA